MKLLDGKPKPTITVGLESTLDKWITFPSLGDFGKLAQTHKGCFSKYVKDAFKLLSAGKGDEVSIDGKRAEAQELLKQAKHIGADVKCTLGGNGALEAAAFKALGSNVIFAGRIFPKQIRELPPDSRKFFGQVDFSFASALENFYPSSYILQARGTNRYILCEGQGRRIEQLRPYLEKLPDTLEQIMDKYGNLDMINLVGWQVLFANGINDEDIGVVKKTVNKIRGMVNSPLFTDAGGLATFNTRDRARLFQIYSLFDVLSINEDEILQISKAIGIDTKDELKIMNHILETSEKLSTIWLHSLDFQISLSKKYKKELLEKAQIASAAAGAYRVENGNYATLAELNKRIKVKNYSEKGLRKVKDGTKERVRTKDVELAITPCLVARNFTSTVGAGDVSAAAYANVISRAQIKN
ncbi:MAG: ADP-dependent glucokinase/phosphofructokinase [Methanobacteriota archaeon]